METPKKDKNEQSDNKLLSSYLSGDYAAFEVLYARHKDGVYRYLFRQIHDKSVIDDLFQEVWGKVISQSASFNAQAQFSTWLYTIARHSLIDHVRHLKMVNRIIETPAAQDNPNNQEINQENNQENIQLDKQSKGIESNSPESYLEQNKQASAIDYCLKKLPNHQLDCFLLREESGLAIADISQIVNAGVEATKSRLRAAYSSLRSCLEKRVDTPNYSRRGGKAS